jgi:hypothetical protein
MFLSSARNQDILAFINIHVTTELEITELADIVLKLH